VRRYGGRVRWNDGWAAMALRTSAGMVCTRLSVVITSSRLKERRAAVPSKLIGSSASTISPMTVGCVRLLLLRVLLTAVPMMMAVA
jgi:hypothetical protein